MLYPIRLTANKGWQVDESPKRKATHWIDARIVASGHPGLEIRARVKLRAIAEDWPDGLPAFKAGKTISILTGAPAVKAKGGGSYFFIVPSFAGASRPQKAVIKSIF